MIYVEGLSLCLLGLVSQGVHTNLLDHRQKTIAAGRTQMVLQTNLLYEIEVGIHNLGWSMTAQHTNQEGDDSLYDKRIAIGCEYELAILHSRTATIHGSDSRR